MTDFHETWCEQYNIEELLSSGYIGPFCMGRQVPLFGRTCSRHFYVDRSVELYNLSGCWQPYRLHVPIVLKSGSLTLLEPSGPVQACNRIALPFNFSKLHAILPTGTRQQEDIFQFLALPLSVALIGDSPSDTHTHTHTHTHTYIYIDRHIFIIPITTASAWTKFRRITMKMVVLSSAQQVKCTTWRRNPKYDLYLKEACFTVRSVIFKSPVLFKSPKQEVLKS